MCSLGSHDSNEVPSPSCPPWEVLVLVAHHMDPETLATASCVDKSWLACFSSDHLWAPFCSAHFPSLSTVPGPHPRRLYALGHAARRCRLMAKRRPKPKLSLDRLLFALSLSTKTKSIQVVEKCAVLRPDPHGMFRFDVEVKDEKEWEVTELDEMKVTWHVVEGDWAAVFALAEECGGKGSFASGVDGWFSEELPSATGWCFGGGGGGGSGMVADIRLGLVEVGGGGGGETWSYCRRSGAGGRSKVRIEKVSVGILSVLNWRYVGLEDGLVYLEQFLLEPNESNEKK